MRDGKGPDPQRHYRCRCSCAARHVERRGPADSSQRVRGGYDTRDPDSYDYNVPLALPPYGYAPSFWGYGGRRYYDRFGNYKKYGQEPGEPDTGPVESRPLR